MLDWVASCLIVWASALSRYPSFTFWSVTRATFETYFPCVGYRLCSVGASNGRYLPQIEQKNPGAFGLALVAMGASTAERRIPPLAMPKLSRASTAPRGPGPTETTSSGVPRGG